MPLVAVTAGATGLSPCHAVRPVCDRPHMGLIDGLAETGPAGTAFELGPCAEKRQAALSAAEHACPLLAQQGPAERRLGPVRQKDPLFLGRQISLQRLALPVARRCQVIAGRGAPGQGGVGIGHGPEIGRVGREFQRTRPPPLLSSCASGRRDEADGGAGGQPSVLSPNDEGCHRIPAWSQMRSEASIVSPPREWGGETRSALLEQRPDPGPNGVLIGRFARPGQTLGRGVGLVVGPRTRGPGLVAVAEV